MKLTFERFSIPEVLFHPSDIGISQAGLPEAIIQTVNKCPELFAEPLLQNIVLSGGSCNLPGFKTRLE